MVDSNDENQSFRTLVLIFSVGRAEKERKFDDSRHELQRRRGGFGRTETKSAKTEEAKAQKFAQKVKTLSTRRTRTAAGDQSLP